MVTCAPAFAALTLLGLATLWVVTAADDSILSTSRLNSPGFDFLGLVPATRREIDISKLDCGQAAFPDCLAASGVTYRLETYVSNSQYPRMMLTISGLDVLIAGALIGLGARGLRRRDLCIRRRGHAQQPRTTTEQAAPDLARPLAHLGR